MPFYLGATAAASRLPHILKWSCSELGLSQPPPAQTTLWLFLLLPRTNKPPWQIKLFIKGSVNNMLPRKPCPRRNVTGDFFHFKTMAIFFVWLKPCGCQLPLILKPLELTGVVRAPQRCVWARLLWWSCHDLTQILPLTQITVYQGTFSTFAIFNKKQNKEKHKKIKLHFEIYLCLFWLA